MHLQEIVVNTGNTGIGVDGGQGGDGYLIRR